MAGLMWLHDRNCHFDLGGVEEFSDHKRECRNGWVWIGSVFEGRGWMWHGQTAEARADRKSSIFWGKPVCVHAMHM